MHCLKARLEASAVAQAFEPVAILRGSPQAHRRYTTTNMQFHAMKRPNGQSRLLRPDRTLRQTPSNEIHMATEIKNNLKYQVKLGIYWTVLGWAILTGIGIGGYMLRQDRLDRQYPSPKEWHWVIKQLWRQAKQEFDTEGNGRGRIDWGAVGTMARDVVRKLEDFKFIKHYPTGLVAQTSFDHTIPGIDEVGMSKPPEQVGDEPLWATRIGYDITMKSEPWRRGYYEAMMLLARSAEERTGHMIHKKTRKVFPPEHVRSPDNPYPKPIRSSEKIESPDIQDCEPVLETPDFHYKRLLTAKGFSRRQRMDAGIAYAHWLEHTGRTSLAQQMYDWSLGLALEGVPTPSRIVNRKTAVLDAQAPFVTANILSAVTALASFKGRNGDVSASLPIFLSILRARQASPPAPPIAQYPRKPISYDTSTVEGFLQWLRSLPFPPADPPIPSSGDEPFERARSGECEEAALMAYVGEILFARGGRRAEGLSWTKRAASIAEERVEDKALDTRGTRTCEQCLHTSLENWMKMTRILAREQQEAPAMRKSTSWLFGDEDSKILRMEDWQTEARIVEKRFNDLQEKKLHERLNAYIRNNSSMFVV